uniref:ribosomal protein L9 n=1 Tax=Chroodactylon ornatum TaxID=139907 RepID=UPI001FCD0327|nr:ribosomal protein L9 [Chroodactylon ornatum]UNJ14621.1 ribosomal protein L9 [Chroodactylon ornatum]
MSKKTIPVLLQSDVTNLGITGSLVNVKAGYARNHLLPKNLAILATPNIIKQAQWRTEIRKQNAEKAKAVSLNTKLLLEKINNISFKKKIGKQDAIFGTVTEKEIAVWLSNILGTTIEKKQIELDEIKTTGNFSLQIKLDHQFIAIMELYIFPNIVIN